MVPEQSCVALSWGDLLLALSLPRGRSRTSMAGDRSEISRSQCRRGIHHTILLGNHYRLASALSGRATVSEIERPIPPASSQNQFRAPTADLSGAHPMAVHQAERLPAAIALG